MRRTIVLTAVVAALFPAPFLQAETDGHPDIQIKRSAGAITVDGDLSDPGWAGAARVDQWWETNPGDNLEPKVKSVGYLTYDDKFFYAAFEFSDPDPTTVRAPYGDHDNVSGNLDDYAGVILDTRNDGKTAMMFLANPRGIQYDAISDDTTGNEDNSPDFYWDSAGRITKTGWTLEIRIPFSSLRYNQGDPQAWGILLYRNRPRDRRYQMFANKIPRGSNCFICNEDKLVGLSGLPSGSHLVAAPYVTARLEQTPREGLGKLQSKNLETDAGLDSKWNPTADTAVDLTLNPDFSQVESDATAISTNERFAIFYPEKRPFFLEGVELFNTPLRAVYTRTITAPRWGLRSTGKFSSNAYTLLIAQDRGGGLVVLPGPSGSDFANQDFSSTVGIGRLRHDFGKSFVSGLFTDRENQGGGHNRVFGPDFQWRSGSQTLTGQLLISDTVTPNRPTVTDQWMGQKLSSHAGDLSWKFNSPKVDLYTEYVDFGNGFRADDGFIPQVGFRENFGEGGYTFRPKGIFSRVRTFALADYQSNTDGQLLFREVSFGSSFDARYNINGRFRMSYVRVRSGNLTLPRRQLRYALSASPNRFVSGEVSGWVGEEVDFVRSRLGRGANIALSGTLRPTDHLAFELSSSLLFLNVIPDEGPRDEYHRLFTAQVERLRTTYTFSSKAFLRLITQNVRNRNNPTLYKSDDVRRRSGSVTDSLLVAYKLNFQTVIYVGLGDSNSLTEENHLKANDRQLFMKLSYAFQR